MESKTGKPEGLSAGPPACSSFPARAWRDRWQPWQGVLRPDAPSSFADTLGTWVASGRSDCGRSWQGGSATRSHNDGRSPPWGSVSKWLLRPRHAMLDGVVGWARARPLAEDLVGGVRETVAAPDVGCRHMLRMALDNVACHSVEGGSPKLLPLRRAGRRASHSQARPPFRGIYLCAIASSCVGLAISGISTTRLRTPVQSATSAAIRAISLARSSMARAAEPSCSRLAATRMAEIRRIMSCGSPLMPWRGSPSCTSSHIACDYHRGSSRVSS